MDDWVQQLGKLGLGFDPRDLQQKILVFLYQYKKDQQICVKFR